MTKDIFIGLDGGGTKTKLIVEDAKENTLGEGRGGPANIRNSVNKAWDSIFHALNAALHGTNISLNDPNYLFHVGMGLAGTEIPSACENFLMKPHPFKTLVLKSDAYTACLGAHGGEDGDIIIIGTGVIGFQINEGMESQVNGWGFPHADEGGGAWLGMEAIRMTLQWQDAREEKSPLLEEIFNYFDNDLTKMVVWANEAKSTQFAEIAPYVMQYLEKKDPFSQKLVQMSAKEIEKIDCALEKLSHKKLSCSLFGGIASFIEPYLSKNLKNRITPRKEDAAKGAIFMIKKQVSSGL